MPLPALRRGPENLQFLGRSGGMCRLYAAKQHLMRPHCRTRCIPLLYPCYTLSLFLRHHFCPHSIPTYSILLLPIPPIYLSLSVAAQSDWACSSFCSLRVSVVVYCSWRYFACRRFSSLRLLRRHLMPTRLPSRPQNIRYLRISVAV